MVVGGREIKVQVDLLAGEYGGTGKSRRHQRVQDITPRKARGCDLAFEMTSEVNIEGTLPGGGKDRVVVRVAGIVPFIVMKAMALADRMKEKDAWDIWFCLAHYPGDRRHWRDAFHPHLRNRLVAEGLSKLQEKLHRRSIRGRNGSPTSMKSTTRRSRAIRQRDAYERVSNLLARLGIA